MPLSAEYTTLLEPGGFYHIYNRGNNFQTVFREERDYTSFLKKWRQYIYPVAKTLAYSLQPNHFHALVQIREAPLYPDLPSPEGKDLASPEGITPRWITRAFANFFISFARTMQNRHGFHGAVFHSPYKRKTVGDELYLDWMMAYIHYNAMKHGIVQCALHEYPHSSYRSLVSSAPTLLEREFVYEYFGGKEKFIDFHLRMASAFELREDLE